MHYPFSYRPTVVETVETSCSITVNSLRDHRNDRIVPTESARKIRIVVAKPGLDGHDRGAKIIARALRDAGMEVIYTGLHQTPEQIAETAIQEDADAVGLSILSGAHMTLVPRVVELLSDQGAGDVVVTVGGTIPADDIPELKKLGVAEVFTPGAPTDEIVQFVRKAVAGREEASAAS
jgi:methylmalonyl-CoA mutase cobalamin-binding domain/chain